jgi:hypothetical protein
MDISIKTSFWGRGDSGGRVKVVIMPWLNHLFSSLMALLYMDTY